MTDHFKRKFGLDTDGVEGKKGPKDEESQQKDHSNQSRAKDKRYALPHIQKCPKSYGISGATLSQSFPRTIDALVGYLRDLCNQSTSAQTSEIITKFETFWQDAKAIRVQRREEKIGLTVQHEMVAAEWRGFWSMDFFETARQESMEQESNGTPFKRHSWAREEKIPYLG